MTRRLKQKLFTLLEGRSNDRAAWIFAVAMMSLIVTNVIAVILVSEETLAAPYRDVFWWFEVFSVAVFTLEYALRVWACSDATDVRMALRERLRFVANPLALIDLFAIAPFYLSYLSAGFVDLRFLRTFRLFRLVRVLKLGRYSAAGATLRNVFVSKREELTVSVVVVLLLMLLGSGLLYLAEREAQPGAFASIREAFWWAILTLSAVNYVDATPITPIGRVLGVLLALLNLALLAIPTGIIGSGFVEEFQRRREPASCPACGEPIPRASVDDPPRGNARRRLEAGGRLPLLMCESFTVTLWPKGRVGSSHASPPRPQAVDRVLPRSAPLRHLR